MRPARRRCSGDGAGRSASSHACRISLVQQIPVGAIALVDGAPHPFGASELAVLEYVGARWTTLLTNPAAEPVLDLAGVLSGSAFDQLGAVMSYEAARQDLAIGLTLLALPSPIPEGGLTSAMESMPGPRVLAGLVRRRRVAVLAIDPDIEVVSERLLRSREALARHTEWEACSEVTIEAPAPEMKPRWLLGRAEQLLMDSNANGKTTCAARSARRRRVPPVEQGADRKPRQRS